MSATDRPTAAISRLFRRLFPGALGEEVAADLDEEYGRRRESLGTALARLWYVSHFFLPSTWRLAIALRRRAGSAERTSRAPLAVRVRNGLLYLAHDSDRPPYLAAALAAGAVFALYVMTLAPTTAFWDTSEYIASAHILGIPHPPGNPLFVSLARVWALLLSPTGLSVAVRVNLLAAFTSALSNGLLFLVAHRILTALVRRPRVALVGAAVSALIGATGFTVWNQSNVNEKVYTISVLVIASVTWLALRWMDRKGEPGSERLLLIAGYLIVLGNANHLMSVLPAPSLALFVLLTGPAVLFRRSFWMRALPLVLIGLSYNVFLPMRAAERPVINEGDPVCDSATDAVVATYTLGKAGCPALAGVLEREQYAKPPVTQRMAPLAHQVSNWFQYFDWQWARSASPSELPSNARTPFTVAFGLLSALGLMATYRADRRIFAYVASLLMLLTVGLVFYLNFEYGYSLAPDVIDQGLREVRERDYFFIAGFLFLGMLAGIGLSWVWDRVAARVRMPRAHLATSPILLVAAIPLVMNASWASRKGDYAARSYAYDQLMSVEPYGILFTNGDNDTFPLWYLQEVEGIRKDVTVIVGMYLNTPWYPRQLQELTSPAKQRAFELSQAAGLYGRATPPTHAILRSTPDEVDAVIGGRTQRDLAVPFPGMAVRYPAGTAFNRIHLLALQIMHDSIDERPIYFSSSGGLMQELGLDGFAVRHGLASKLVLRPADQPRPPEIVKASPEMGGEWFDYDRSMKLYNEVYDFRGFKDRKVWPDHANSVPMQYYALAMQLSDVAAKKAAPDSQLRQLESDAQDFLATAVSGRLAFTRP